MHRVVIYNTNFRDGKSLVVLNGIVEATAAVPVSFRLQLQLFPRQLR